MNEKLLTWAVKIRQPSLNWQSTPICLPPAQYMTLSRNLYMPVHTNTPRQYIRFKCDTNYKSNPHKKIWRAMDCILPDVALLNRISILIHGLSQWPAARSKIWTVFARSNTGIVSSNLTQATDICVCVILWVGGGLVTGWSPVQGALPCIGLRNWKSGQHPTKGCRATDRQIDREIYR
jgi:hypothetical protein